MKDSYIQFPFEDANSPKESTEIKILLDRARNHKMTDEEIQSQRESWVRGMTIGKVAKTIKPDGSIVYYSYKDYCMD